MPLSFRLESDMTADQIAEMLKDVAWVEKLGDSMPYTVQDCMCHIKALASHIDVVETLNTELTERMRWIEGNLQAMKDGALIRIADLEEKAKQATEVASIQQATGLYVVPTYTFISSRIASVPRWRVRTRDGYDMPLAFIVSNGRRGEFDTPSEAILAAHAWFHEHREDEP